MRVWHMRFQDKDLLIRAQKIHLDALFWPIASPVAVCNSPVLMIDHQLAAHVSVVTTMPSNIELLRLSLVLNKSLDMPLWSSLLQICLKRILSLTLVLYSSSFAQPKG